MQFNMRGCISVGTSLSLVILAVCVSVDATQGFIYPPEDQQGLAEHNNTTAQLTDFASLSAPLFRNAISGSAAFEIDSSFRLDARAGGCQCFDSTNECCTPSASSDAPFCMPTGSTCCINTFCVATESCCGDGGCCPANTTCYTKSTGPGCCPDGHFCSEPAICYDYNSSNCSISTTPSPQCCPPDLPFCNYLEQVGYGCYATSATSKPSTSSTKSGLTATTSPTQTGLMKTITVTIISNPTGGLNLKFPTFPQSHQPTEEGKEVTKYVLSNGAAMSLENNPDSPQTGIASFIITGTLSSTTSKATTSSNNPTSPTIISPSSPPISTPPNPTTTTAEFPLATTISTSQSPPILTPIHLLTTHPYIVSLLSFFFFLYLLSNDGPDFLTILYPIFFHNDFPTPTLVPEETQAETKKQEEARRRAKNEARKKRTPGITFNQRLAKLIQERNNAQKERMLGITFNQRPAKFIQERNNAQKERMLEVLQWKLALKAQKVEKLARRVVRLERTLEKLERRLDKVERRLERIQWIERMERRAGEMYKKKVEEGNAAVREAQRQLEGSQGMDVGLGGLGFQYVLEEAAGEA